MIGLWGDFPEFMRADLRRCAAAMIADFNKAAKDKLRLIEDALKTDPQDPELQAKAQHATDLVFRPVAERVAADFAKFGAGDAYG